MIGAVIIAHGELANAFLVSANQVVGPQSQVEAISITPESDTAKVQDALAQAVSRVNTGDGVIIITDMFGGASSHLAMSMMSQPMIEVISGVNLPMLIKLFSKRKNAGLAECVASAEKAAKKYINVASSLLEPQSKAA